MLSLLCSFILIAGKNLSAFEAPEESIDLGNFEHNFALLDAEGSTCAYCLRENDYDLASGGNASLANSFGCDTNEAPCESVDGSPVERNLLSELKCKLAKDSVDSQAYFEVPMPDGRLVKLPHMPLMPLC